MSHPARGPEPQPVSSGRECCLAGRVFALHQTMWRVADRLSASIGLTASRWLVLCAVGHAPEPPSVSDISHAAQMSVQNTSRMLVAMEREGLVRRDRGAGRGVLVRLTAKGRRALASTEPLADRFESALLHGVNARRLERIERDIERLVQNLSRLEEELARE